jgi:hypothetical protein
MSPCGHRVAAATAPCAAAKADCGVHQCCHNAATAPLGPAATHGKHQDSQLLLGMTEHQLNASLLCSKGNVVEQAVAAASQVCLIVLQSASCKLHIARLPGLTSLVLPCVPSLLPPVVPAGAPQMLQWA